MRKRLFSSKTVRALVVVGAITALPVSAASANTRSQEATTIFVTAQGTSLLGTPVPVLGTQGFTLTVPVASGVVPQFVSKALDVTVTSELTVGGVQVFNLYVDPWMR